MNRLIGADENPSRMQRMLMSGELYEVIGDGNMSFQNGESNTVLREYQYIQRENQTEWVHTIKY